MAARKNLGVGGTRKATGLGVGKAPGGVGPINKGGVAAPGRMKKLATRVAKVKKAMPNKAMPKKTRGGY
jgi:hypothetical protein